MSIVQLGDMAKELDRLRAELEAERAKGAEDTRRLEWMAKYRASAMRLPSGRWSVAYYPDLACNDTERRGSPILRDAIDAGRKATGDLP